jgi:hypothetical protein
MRFLVRLDSRSWLLIYLIRERRKAIFLGAVKESPLLEDEGCVLFSSNLSKKSAMFGSRLLWSAHIIPDQLADLG